MLGFNHMNDTPKLKERWDKTLEELGTDIFYLANIDNVYHQTFAIMINNPELRKSGEFQALLHNTYITTLTIGIRRLTDKRKDTDSLMRLLLDMKKHLSKLNKFSEIDPYGKTITHSLIDEKISTLEKGTSLSKAIANEFLAHKKRNPKSIRFNYDEIRKPLAEIFSVFKWCRMTILGKTLLKAVPEIQNNWLEVFRFPWLSEGEQVPRYKKLDDFID